MPLLFILGVFGMSFLFGGWQIKQARVSWGLVAREFGLTVNDMSLTNSPEMSGTFAEGRILVDVHTTGSGKNRKKWTRYSVIHTPIGPPLTLSRQGTFSFLRRFGGGVDLEIGDPFFDEEVIIDSEYADDVKLFLTPARQAAVLNLFSRYRSARITDREVVVSTAGLETNHEPMLTTLRLLVDVAKVMGDPGAVDTLLSQQQAGDLRRAAEGLHELNEQQANAFTQQLEAEAWTEVGDHEKAAPIFAKLTEVLPDDSGVSNWSRVANAPSPPPPPAPPPPEPPCTT